MAHTVSARLANDSIRMVRTAPSERQGAHTGARRNAPPEGRQRTRHT
ncbi:hypothetical protein [Nitrosomonas sp.]|nr:hypothetical protein [Nitrosomonas sp.]MCC6917267.1 hypothetical protein [Nitrosomonas sp.]